MSQTPATGCRCRILATTRATWCRECREAADDNSSPCRTCNGLGYHANTINRAPCSDCGSPSDNGSEETDR